MDKLGNMDNTVFSQTMDIDVDFDGNQSYQPTRMLSMYANHTFNFEDTEVTFEFTRYVKQLCDEMEEAKNRIDGSSDAEAIKSLLSNLIEKVQNDISLVNNSINASSVNQTLLNNTTPKINGNTTMANTTMANTTMANTTMANTTMANTTNANNTMANNTTIANNTTLLSSQSKNETSLLGLLADLFREDRHEQSPIENIRKLSLVNQSLKELKDLSANLNNSMQNRSVLKSIREEDADDKENSKNETFQENGHNMSAAEMTFINKSVCAPLMELLSAVEKKIDIEALEEGLKAKYEQQLKEKDDVISEKDELIAKLQRDILNLEEKCKDHDETREQLARAKQENEVLDEIISDEKRKIAEKQSTIEELNVQISKNLDQISAVEGANIELKKEVNRLNLVEKENKSLSEQVTDLMAKVDRIFELEKRIRILNVEVNEKQNQIETTSFELKTTTELSERLQREKTDLIGRLEAANRADVSKAAKINELQEQASQLSAQLSLQNDKFDFISAKLKDVTALKGQLESDRKDVCWQINELLKNPDIDFDDLKTFLVRVEEKINNVDIKKPKGASFVKSLAAAKEAGKA